MGARSANAAAKVDNIRRPKEAKVVNRRWRNDELETVLERAPPWLRAAIAIAAYTGMRESDVARVPWKKYNGREFETRQVKTGEPIWVAAHCRLREIDPRRGAVGESADRCRCARPADGPLGGTISRPPRSNGSRNGIGASLGNGTENRPSSHWKGTKP